MSSARLTLSQQLGRIQVSKASLFYVHASIMVRARRIRSQCTTAHYCSLDRRGRRHMPPTLQHCRRGKDCNEHQRYKGAEAGDDATYPDRQLMMISTLTATIDSDLPSGKRTTPVCRHTTLDHYMYAVRHGWPMAQLMERYTPTMVPQTSLIALAD